MEEYEDIKNDAFNAFDASSRPDAITVIKKHGYEAAGQREQIVHQLAIEVEKNLSGHARVFKAASRNVTKRTKMRKTRIITKTSKTVETTAK